MSVSQSNASKSRIGGSANNLHMVNGGGNTADPHVKSAVLAANMRQAGGSHNPEYQADDAYWKGLGSCMMWKVSNGNYAYTGLEPRNEKYS